MGNENGVLLESKDTGVQIIIKFKKEAGARIADAQVSSTTQTDLSKFASILNKNKGVAISRLFDQTESELESDVAKVRNDSGQEVSELSGYYTINATSEAQAKKILKSLEGLDYLEDAYIEPPAMPAFFDPPVDIADIVASNVEVAATPDFKNQQGYLNPAPAGVDAYYAWTQAGGKGTGVKVIDIEGGWNFSHEDLLQNQGGVVGGTPTPNIDWENHGTAVQGEIAGDENTLGVTGITPKANFSAVSIFGSGNSTAKALKTAADKLSKGDIILIELHRGGPNANGQGQFGFIAIEWWTADFDAVKYATAKGIIVIAAAGNGSQNLDDAVYNKKFDRSFRDSGAILVGAGAPPSGNHGPDRSRLGFSNYGAIIDAQGWGREVVTTGYGDLQGGSNKNRHYTKQFSGTSSASPIVVGAVAAMQGVRKAGGQSPLNYKEVRNILRSTGSPQTNAPGRPVSQRIGNRPNLKQALPLISSGTLKQGIATKYWLELKAYPQGTARSLWLFVDNIWKKQDNPSNVTSDCIQRAFLLQDSQVRVWYDNSQDIKGLIVEGT